MIKVYIAGPYTKGDQAINVKRAMEAAIELINLGIAPYCPHLFHFLHLVHPQDWEVWVEQGLQWLAVCDYMIRLPGESAGADIEAREWINMGGERIFSSVDELIDYLDNQSDKPKEGE